MKNLFNKVSNIKLVGTLTLATLVLIGSGGELHASLKKKAPIELTYSQIEELLVSKQQNNQDVSKNYFGVDRYGNSIDMDLFPGLKPTIGIDIIDPLEPTVMDEVYVKFSDIDAVFMLSRFTEDQIKQLNSLKMGSSDMSTKAYRFFVLIDPDLEVLPGAVFTSSDMLNTITIPADVKVLERSPITDPR